MSDNLVFWLTYGHEGKGCSLSLTVPRSQLQKVLYGPKKVKSTANALRSILDLLGQLVKIENRSIRGSIQNKLAETVWKSLERIRYLYKSEACEYENECRFVVAESDISEKDNIRFEDQGRNNSPARLRHYYEHETLEIKKLLGTNSSITLGPSVSNYYNIHYYIQTLLDKADLSFNPTIKKSSISFRKS